MGSASLTDEIGLMEIWTQRLGPRVDPRELVGFAVTAGGAHVGEVEDGSDAKGIGRLHVALRSLAKGKRLIPFGLIDDVDFATRTVSLGSSQEQIETAPDFDPEVHGRDARYFELVGDHYRHGARG
jgi:hypothetical protein